MEIFTKTKFENNDEICCICHLTFKQNEKVNCCMRCKKNIHIECTKKLLQFKNECPNCRYGYQNEINNFDYMELMFFSNQIVDINHTMMEIAILMNVLKYCFIFMVFIIILCLSYFFYF